MAGCRTTSTVACGGETVPELVSLLWKSRTLHTSDIRSNHPMIGDIALFTGKNFVVNDAGFDAIQAHASAPEPRAPWRTVGRRAWPCILAHSTVQQISPSKISFTHGHVRNSPSTRKRYRSTKGGRRTRHSSSDCNPSAYASTYHAQRQARPAIPHQDNNGL